jgi:uncharacterized protein (TIGR03437 family)
VDAAGNLYIADYSIRKVSNGIISTVGTGGARWLKLDTAGNFYFTGSDDRVYKLANGILTTIAGGCSTCPPVGDGVPGTRANLAQVGGLDVDSGGRVYFADVFGVAALSPWQGAPVSTIASDGILNAASFMPGPVAPGSIATALGSFGLNTPAQATTAMLPTALSGLSMQLQSGIGAPLFYASAGQVNFQIPWELSSQSSVPISAVLNGTSGPTQILKLAPFAPGIFAMNGRGTGQGAIVDLSYRLVDSTNPTTAGNVIQIYCTGLGAVTNASPTGTPASMTTLSPTTVTPTAKIGGVEALVQFSGLAPSTVGEYVVNVQVPPSVTPGFSVPVVISIGGVTSNAVTIAVQ